MKSKTYKKMKDFGKDLGLSDDEMLIADLKTKIKKKIIAEVEKRKITQTELAKLAGLGRTVVSGVINGSLQSVSLERLIKILMAMDLLIDIKIKKSA